MGLAIGVSGHRISPSFVPTGVEFCSYLSSSRTLSLGGKADVYTCLFYIPLKTVEIALGWTGLVGGKSRQNGACMRA